MIGRNELLVNPETIKTATRSYLESIGFPGFSIDYIDSAKNGEEDSHTVFMQSELFGGIFSIECNNEFLKHICSKYIKDTIKSPVYVTNVSYTQFPSRYTIAIDDAIVLQEDDD